MASASSVPRGTPAVDAAEQAIGHVRRHLFPFRLERWLALGFISFLDQCPRQGSGSFRLPLPGGDESGDLSQMGSWLAANVLLVSVIAAVVLAAFIALMAVVLWVHSRAVFVYIDDVATGRADIARPWQENGRLADSYFRWNLGLLLVALVGVLMMGLVVLGAILGLRDSPAVGPGLILGLVLGLLLVLLPFLLFVALAGVALRDFVAPIQWHGALACGPAVSLFLGLLRGHFWTFVLYLLLKMLFAVVLALITFLACCLTCCCAILPVVHQTLFQPVYYFERAWSLHLLERLGFERFATPPISPVAAPAGPPLAPRPLPS